LKKLTVTKIVTSPNFKVRRWCR